MIDVFFGLIDGRPDGRVGLMGLMEDSKTRSLMNRSP